MALQIGGCVVIAWRCYHLPEVWQEFFAKSCEGFVSMAMYANIPVALVRKLHAILHP